MQITKMGGMAALVLVAALAGCERADPRLEQLTVGIGKDSVIAVMGGERPNRIDPFLYQGQYIETMFFPRQGKTDSASLTDRKMTPVIVINGKLTGWGWNYWDSAAAANRIAVPPKE